MKGLSPLISVVLLIAIAVVIASLIMTWSQSLTTEQQVTVGNRTSELTECGGHSIKVEDVYLDFTLNKSRVTVRNNGQAQASIRAAVLQNQQGTASHLNTTLPIVIRKGELKTLEFLLNSTLDACGNFSQVRVTTECATDVYRKKATNC